MNELPLLGPTKNKILRLLLDRGRKAGDMASSLKIQVSATRKHLEQLSNLGIVTETFQKGSVGRPKKYYAITDKGRELFPRNYDNILNSLITKIVERDGTDQAENLMTSIADDLAQPLRPNGAPDQATGPAMEGLNRLGFQATIERHDKQFTVISRNCPLLKTAVEHREIVCRGLHEELLRKALGREHVTREDWIVTGDGYCKHLLAHQQKTLR